MGKFTAGIATSLAGPSAVEQLQSDVPQAVEPEVAPQAAPEAPVESGSDPILDSIIAGDFSAEEAAEQTQAEYEASPEGQFVQTPEGQAQLENEKIDSIRSRFQQGKSGERINTYQRKKEAAQEGRQQFQSNYGPDGGIFDRAKNLPQQVNKFKQKEDGTYDSIGSVVLGTQVGAAQAVEGKGAPLPQLLQDIGAVTGTGRKETIQFDPDFLTIGSLVTENFLAQEFAPQKQEGAETGFDGDTVQEIADQELEPGAYAKKQANSARLGKDIFAEVNREKQGQGSPIQNLSEEQATLLGDVFKEVYAAANPDIVNRKQVGSQIHFELTNQGTEKMNASATARRLLFPKEHVRALKAPSPTGRQVGEGKTITKKVTGEKGKKRAGNHRKTQEAVANLGSIPNVVDKQREKILYSTIIPVLQGSQNPNAALFGTINNIGESQMNKFRGLEKKDYEARAKDPEAAEGKPYSAQANMENLMNKAAQEVFGIATERKGANYLSYTIQGFAGRLTPNQTHFNPTTSKLARFVTRNATPAKITKGSRTDRNLRQMYAMMLVKGADSKLPNERERALQLSTEKLLGWGRRLRQALDDSMTDSELEAVAAAIQQGTPLNDPSFPQVRGLQLDPEKDAELIKTIASKGEDGQHFIDGVIDFSKYHAALAKDKPYHSYFNAYIDGKTNGLAAMGLQMGSESIALATGVLRTNNTDLLDAGDIRDQLADSLNNRLDDTNNGLDGVAELADVKSEIYDVARGLFNWRDFNKKTTMVFGYGMDIIGFKPMMDEYTGEIQQTALNMDAETLKSKRLTNFAASLDVVNQKIDELNKKEGTTKTLGDFLLPTYESAMMDVLDPDAIASRQLMKASAFYAAMGNKLFEIDGPGGFPLKFGGVDESTLGEVKERQQYTLGGDKREAITYERPQESARHRKAAPEGKEGKLSAVGASVPGPIHATDAYAITNTVSGRSWKKLKDASGGNPYFHSIYDAIKMDANGYDVVLEEINNNWYDANTKWNFLSAMSDSVAEVRKEMTETAKAINPTERLNIDKDVDAFIANMFVTDVSSKGNVYPKGAFDTFKNLYEPDIAMEYAKTFEVVMKNQGFDINNNTGEITGRQLQEAYSYFLKNFNIKRELDAQYARVSEKQKKLKSKLAAAGVKNYQYYAH